MVSNLDFAETLLESGRRRDPRRHARPQPRAGAQGQTPADWRKSFYYHYYEYPGPHTVRRHYGVRSDRYKLAYFYRLDEWELYDREKDPQQLKNVYADPAYADIVSQLKAELTRLRTELKVPEDTAEEKLWRPAGSKDTPKKKQ